MKKFLLAGLALCVLFTVTGCDDKKEESGSKKSNLTSVVCTTNIQGVDTELIAYFDGDDIQDMALKYTMDLSDYSSEVITELKKQDFCETVGTATGFGEAFKNCKQSITSKELKVTADIITKKLDGSEDFEDITPDEFADELDNAGYKCKVK